jgi:hypothetical protein
LGFAEADFCGRILNSGTKLVIFVVCPMFCKVVIVDVLAQKVEGCKFKVKLGLPERHSWHQFK